MKKIVLFFALFISNLSFAAPKVIVPLATQPDHLTSQAIGGAGPTGDIVPLSVDSSGNLNVVSSSISPINFNVTITSAGASARTQFSSNTVNSCLLQAWSTNAGSVYYGGATVTNSSGANQGVELIPGSTAGPITLSDSNTLYGATDNANDKIGVFCN